jgi:hypothetical protein
VGDEKRYGYKTVVTGTRRSKTYVLLSALPTRKYAETNVYSGDRRQGLEAAIQLSRDSTAGRILSATLVPNHLFSLLTMIATEAPDSLDSEAVRAKKAKLLKPSGRYARRTPCAVNTRPAQ